MSDNKWTEYKRKFNESNYDRIYLTVKQGRKSELEAIAASHGQSLNKFIQDAIDERIKALKGK